MRPAAPSIPPGILTRLHWLLIAQPRYRLSGARDGPALLDQVAAVRKAVGGVRIVSNGNVRTWEDVVANKELTGADGQTAPPRLLDH